MTLTLCSGELSRKLKEAGFDAPVNTYFFDGDTGTNCTHEFTGDLFSNFNSDMLCISRPSLALAAQWLREVKGMHVSVAPEYEYIASQWSYELFSCNEKDWKLITGFGGYMEHNVALSDGIDNALDYLK